ncbi:MAG: hypothetical protein M1836_001561 [Candelina mexicana]|nr:MAG: hypothetical protein M1836_001561 [Candelina mexicana]
MADGPYTNTRKRKMGKRRASISSSSFSHSSSNPTSSDEDSRAPEPISPSQLKRIHTTSPPPSPINLHILTPEERSNREFFILERIRALLHGSGRGVYLGTWKLMSFPLNPFSPTCDLLHPLNFPCDEIQYRTNLLSGMINYILDKDADIAFTTQLLQDLETGTVDVREVNYPLPRYTSTWRELDASQEMLREMMRSAASEREDDVTVLQSFQLAEQWILHAQACQKDITARLMALWPDDEPFFKPLGEEVRERTRVEGAIVMRGEVVGKEKEMTPEEMAEEIL